MALLNFTALFGFQWAGQLSGILCADFSCDQKSVDTTLQRGVFLALLPGFTILGALFFHANSLRKKRDSLDDGAELSSSAPEKPAPDVIPQTPAPLPVSPPSTTIEGLRARSALPLSAPSATLPQIRNLSTNASKSGASPAGDAAEPFVESRFWAGLYFRIGEALLFALIVFLLAEGGTQKRFGGPGLLLLSLLLGMFVKSGETLIAGIADRTFKAMQAFVKP